MVKQNAASAVANMIPVPSNVTRLMIMNTQKSVKNMSRKVELNERNSFQGKADL